MSRYNNVLTVPEPNYSKTGTLNPLLSRHLYCGHPFLQGENFQLFADSYLSRAIIVAIITDSTRARCLFEL